MHQQSLSCAWPRSRLTAPPDRRLHVHERQRHEFGEAAGLGLQITNRQQMPRPVGIAVHMAEHDRGRRPQARSEEHTSELQSLMRISYAVFCLKKKKNKYR